MKSVLLVVSTLAFAASTAFAADAPPATGGGRAACKADVAALCSGIQPGGGRIAGCLKQNEAKVSPACKDAMAQAHQRKAQAKPTAAQ